MPPACLFTLVPWEFSQHSTWPNKRKAKNATQTRMLPHFSSGMMGVAQAQGSVHGAMGGGTKGRQGGAARCNAHGMADTMGMLSRWRANGSIDSLTNAAEPSPGFRRPIASIHRLQWTLDINKMHSSSLRVTRPPVTAPRRAPASVRRRCHAVKQQTLMGPMASALGRRAPTWPPLRSRCRLRRRCAQRRAAATTRCHT